MFKQASNTARLATKARASARLPTSSTRSYAFGNFETPGTIPPKSNKSGVVFGVAGVTAAAGAYWYFSHPDEAAIARQQAAKHEEDMKRKASELGDATKARAYDAKNQVKISTDSTIQSAEDKARQVAADAQAKYDAYKSSAKHTASDARDSAEAKYDSYKSSAEQSLRSARNSTEDLYNDARSKVAGKSELQKKEEEAKAGWFSWLGWGKSKASDAEGYGKSKAADAESWGKSKSADAEKEAREWKAAAEKEAKALKDQK